MGPFYGSHLALLWAMFLLTDGSNINWLEPPPSETVTDASSISRTNKTVTQGSLNEELSCTFNLTVDLRLKIVSVKFRGRPAVTFVPDQLPLVEPAFAKQFEAVWVPNNLTLIFFNVTDAEEGQYCFEVITMGSSARTWIREIQLSVLDPSQVIGSSITASLDPILTTASSITASEDQIQATVSGITASGDPWQTMVSSITASEDPRQTMVSASITVPQNPILTTASSITASEDPILTTSSSITVCEAPRQTMVSASITVPQTPRQTMVSASITVPQNLITATVSGSTASEDGNTGCIIGIVLGVVAFLSIVVGCYLKRRKCSKSKDQTFFAFRRSHEGRQQSHWYWPT